MTGTDGRANELEVRSLFGTNRTVAARTAADTGTEPDIGPRDIAGVQEAHTDARRL